VRELRRSRRSIVTFLPGRDAGSPSSAAAPVAATIIPRGPPRFPAQLVLSEIHEPRGLIIMSNEQRVLRNALGSFATGVTVVTTRTADGRDIGRTANSFSSVSLDPPMILWSLAKTSSSFEDYRQADHFAVHILSADQSEVSGLFAGKKPDKFEGLGIDRGADDIPLLTECAARFECRTTYQYEGGDHIIFVGEVTGFEHSSTATGWPPVRTEAVATSA
jgi:flavin reductase (DIM6/NTAB) family NADH-FMN oxidoreductase RutF